jgi:hypothetical protein
MKNILFILILLPVYVLAQSDDETAIKSTITSAYIEGIHNGGSIDNIRKGFHPSFHMLRLAENDVKPLGIEEWITSLEKARQENKPQPRTDGKFVSIDITGTAAVAKVEVYRENKKIFTDYIVLYKFAEGWKIVSKSFYRHP